MPRVGWFFTEDQLAFCPVSALSTPYQWTMHSVKEMEFGLYSNMDEGRDGGEVKPELCPQSNIAAVESKK